MRIGLWVDYIGAYGRGIVTGAARYAAMTADVELVTEAMFSIQANQWHWGDIQLDGLIVQVAFSKLVEIGADGRVPTVNVSGIERQVVFPSILPDNRAVGTLAAAHFLERGFRHFVYAGAHAAYSDDRGDAFVTAVQAHGRARTTHVVTWPVDEAASESLADVLVAMPKPLAVFCANDLRAGVVVGACRARGLGVPEQVAVLGVDDDEFVVRMTRPPISSVRLPAEQVGYEAAALVQRLADGGHPPAAPLLLPPLGVVTRRSTDVLAIDDMDVARAVQFIREHAHEPIGIADVLAQVPLSRRSLERRFGLTLQRSPLEELTRWRIERAKELLSSTDLRIADVARRSGIADGHYLSILFRKKTGMSPAQYRRRFRNQPARKRDGDESV